MLRLNKVVKDLRAHRRMVAVLAKCVQRACSAGLNPPLHIHAEFVDLMEGEGGGVGNEYFITVPYTIASDRDRSHLKWIVAHEFTHVVQLYNGGEPNHGEGFYVVLKKVCAPSALHWELAYRPGAKRYGIQKRKRRRLRRV